jgi:type II secretory pathway pseudopilin PulG
VVQTVQELGLVGFYALALAEMPDWMFFGFLFLVAGMVGSFLNVCVWRIPRGQSIVTPRSACPDCGHLLYLKDLVPVLSWLAAGGKCNYCRRPIALRYQWVELANISIWMACWACFGRTLDMLSAAACGSTVLGTLGVAMMWRKLRDEGEAAPPAAARSGFTFLEIMVAVGILAATVTPFMMVVQQNFRGAGKNREYVQAYNLAREKLEELRAVAPERLKGDWEVYVEGEGNIFADEFFGPYARMKQNPENFYQGFSDVWTEEKQLTESVMAKFKKRFKAHYGFDYETYPREYERFRRFTKVEDKTDPAHPNNVIKKVSVTVIIDSTATRNRPITLMAYMVNR